MYDGFGTGIYISHGYMLRGSVYQVVIVDSAAEPQFLCQMQTKTIRKTMVEVRKPVFSLYIY